MVSKTANVGEKAAEGANVVDKAVEGKRLGEVVSETKKVKLKAGTPEHKAARWEKFQREKPDSKLSYEEWSNKYDAGMKNPIKGNSAANAYQKEIGWGKREVSMRDENGKIIRKLDIADVEGKRAVEVKDYSSKNVPYDKDIKAEVAYDKELVKKKWDVEWVFKDKGPSKPLKDALDSWPPIKIKILK